jgi:hypothetical protein
VANTQDDTGAKSVADDKPELPRDQIVQSKPPIAIGGLEISYAVTKGTLVLDEESEKFDHIGLDDSLRCDGSTSFYEAGHMMYIHRPSLAQLKTDLASFIRGALHSTSS